MSDQKNSKIKEFISEQAQTITEQIQKNTPEALNNTGAETVITSIPQAGYYISEPGTYVLANDIDWAPLNPIFYAAIVIQCGNVVLDFNGKTLTAIGDYKTTSLGVIVMDVKGYCDDVTIKNGSIEDMGICALWAVNTHRLNITSMTIENLTYPGFDFLPAAVSLMGANAFTLDSSSIKNVDVTAMMAGAMMVIESDTGTVGNCTVENFTNRDGIACGFLYAEAKGIVTNGCTVTNLTTLYGGDPLSSFGHTCIGFMPTYCSNVTFNDCSATSVHGCCDDCHGISLFSVDGGSVSNFTATDVHDGLGPQKTGAKATGVEVYGNNITISNSHATNITAIVPQDLQATGFSVCGTNVTVQNCTSTGVTVYNAEGTPDTSHGYGTGFGWAPDPRKEWNNPSHNVTYTDCTANHCQLGFDTWNHQDSRWVRPSYTECGKTHLIQAAGTVRTFSMNFCSELPDSTPSSPAKNFPMINHISDNTYPEDWGDE